MVREAAAKSPAEGMGFEAIPVADEAEDGAGHLGGVGEVTVLENPAMKDGEPDLDLIHPRGVLGGVDEMESAAVALGESLPRLAIVDIEIVPDDIDVAGRIAASDRLHEGGQVIGRTPLANLTEHPTSADIESGNQATRTVADVLKLASASAAGRRQDQTPAT